MRYNIGTLGPGESVTLRIPMEPVDQWPFQQPGVRPMPWKETRIPMATAGDDGLYTTSETVIRERYGVVKAGVGVIGTDYGAVNVEQGPQTVQRKKQDGWRLAVEQVTYLTVAQLNELIDKERSWEWNEDYRTGERNLKVKDIPVYFSWPEDEEELFAGRKWGAKYDEREQPTIAEPGPPETPKRQSLWDKLRGKGP